LQYVAAFSRSYGEIVERQANRRMSWSQCSFGSIKSPLQRIPRCQKVTFEPELKTQEDLRFDVRGMKPVASVLKATRSLQGYPGLLVVTFPL
jgi:hypothetical protein